MATTPAKAPAAGWTGHVYRTEQGVWTLYAKCPPGYAPAEWDRAKMKAGRLIALPWPLDPATGQPLAWAEVAIGFDGNGTPHALAAKNAAAPVLPSPQPETYVTP
jgi:hypothetical protein